MTIAPAFQLRTKSKPIQEIDEDEFYPSSDGKPMAETDQHRHLGIYFIEALTSRYSNDANVYVTGNNFLYYSQGDRTACVSPDCYVVFGIPMYPRTSYKAWEEGGKLPSVVFEFTSQSTNKEDQIFKLPLYENTLKIPEYFQFDPTGDYLTPRLQGYKLENGSYVRQLLVNNRLYSSTLSLEFVIDGEKLRIFDPIKNEWLRSPQEEFKERIHEHQRAEAERMRADRESIRAETERQRADNESVRAENANRKAEETAKENERLRALLNDLQSGK